MNKVHNRIIKIVVSFALALVVVLGVSGNLYERTPAEEDDSNFTNLIIFMRFTDEDEFIDNIYENTTVRRITDNSYNTAMYNVGDYFRTISENKCRIKSVYLFDNGGSIKLSHQRGYYAEYSETNTIGYKDAGEAASRMYDLKLEWSEAVNKALAAGNPITNYDGTVRYSYDELDKNGDGVIDAITIIYKNTTQSNISVGWASPLWNYQDYCDYVTVSTDKGTIRSGKYVQLTNSYTKPDGDTNGYLFKDSQGNISVSISVASHEMGHIMGWLDLYNTSNASPVYYMSVMAKHMTPVPQFPSLKEKEVLGWVNEGDVQTIIASGEYSIRALGTNGQEAAGYKLDIPEKGKTLYLEYRNFDSNGNKYDSQYKDLYKMNGNRVDRIPMKSGLVCYLIDSSTKFPNNMNYSSPRWNYEVIGGIYGTKTDAALAVDDEIWITDDIGITVTSIEGNTLRFTIEGNFKEHIHSGGQATCVSRAICSVCHQEYGELDSERHEHTAVKGAKASSCTEHGYTGDTYCEDCNKLIGNGFEIDLLPHKLQHVQAEAATAAKEGNIEYYYCTACGNYFLDKNAENQIEKGDTIIAKLPPVIINGNNAVIDAVSGNAVVFRSDAAFSDFICAQLDAKELVKDKDYTVSEGSIIVTLLPETISKLSEGSHKLGIVSSSGTAIANFSVTKPQQPSSEEQSSSEVQTSTESESSSESETSTESESSSEVQTSTESESSSESETSTESESSSESETSTESESSSESETSTESESSSESETSSEAESSSESETSSEAETSSKSETSSESQTSSEVEMSSQDRTVSSNPESKAELYDGNESDDSNSGDTYLSPSTGKASKLRAWMIVCMALTGVFFFITKRS